MANTTTYLELAKGDLARVKVDGRHFRPLDNVVQGVVTCRSFVVSLVATTSSSQLRITYSINVVPVE